MLQGTIDFIRIVSCCPPTNWTLDRLSITSIRSLQASRLPIFYKMPYLRASNGEMRRRKKTSITATTARCWPREKDYYNSSLQLMFIDSDMAKISVKSFEAQPILNSYGTEKALTELSTLISTLKAQAHPLKDRPELMENLVKLSKDMTPLWERFNHDNSVSELHHLRSVKQIVVPSSTVCHVLNFRPSTEKAVNGNLTGRNLRMPFQRMYH